MIARYWKRRIKANQDRIKSGIITCHPTSILVCVMLMWIKKEINFSEPLLLTKTLLCFIWALNKVLSYNIRLSRRRWVFRKDIFSWKLKSWVWVMMLHKMTFYWNVILLKCIHAFLFYGILCQNLNSWITRIAFTNKMIIFLLNPDIFLNVFFKYM